MLIKKEQQQS